MKQVITTLLVLSVASAVYAQTPQASGPLADGYPLAGVDGEVVRTEQGWAIRLDEAIVADGGGIAAVSEVELLPSRALERIVEAIGDRDSLGVKLWGRVTLYGGKNYIFATDFLRAVPPVEAAPQRPQEEEDAAAPAAVEEEPAPRETPAPGLNEEGDEIRLPQELLDSMRRARRVAPVRQMPEAETEEPADAGEPVEPITPVSRAAERMIVDRYGFVTRRDGWTVFELEGLGRNAATGTLRLLPSEATANIEALIRGAVRVRLRIAGTVTEFQGREYLLPSRAVRAFGHGNFE